MSKQDGNVVELFKKSGEDIPDSVLESSKGNYESLFIMGFDDAGCLDVRATSNLTHERILFLMELFKVKLLKGDYGDVG